MFDENDGFFDHMVPPMPPATREQGLSTVATTHEIFSGSKKYPGGPYGLGVRVPMLVISPWSKGGWVNSQVFDHTSLIRFVEQRFGVTEPNITPWRRAVAGDLTSAFDFKTSNASVMPLPSTVAYRPPDNQKHPDYKPAPPAEQRMPVQEAGTRPARALPYGLGMSARVDRTKRAVELSFGNSGSAAAVFHVRISDGASGARGYTVGPGAELKDSLPAIGTAYNLAVYGPNGFYRALSGKFDGSVADVEVDAIVTVTHSGGGVTSAGIILTLRNAGGSSKNLTIRDGYTKKTLAIPVAAGATEKKNCSLDASFGWYDLLVETEGDPDFRRHFAGHVETGRDSITDPAIADSLSEA
jgi:phospholipase C